MNEIEKYKFLDRDLVSVLSRKNAQVSHDNMFV